MTDHKLKRASFRALGMRKKDIVAILAIYVEWNLPNVACLWHNRSCAGWDKHIKEHRFSAFHNFRNSFYLKRAVFYISECFENYFRQ